MNAFLDASIFDCSISPFLRFCSVLLVFILYWFCFSWFYQISTICLFSYLGMFSCACGTQVDTSNTTLNCPAPFQSTNNTNDVAIGSVWMCPGTNFEVLNIFTCFIFTSFYKQTLSYLTTCHVKSPIPPCIQSDPGSCWLRIYS